MYFEIIGQITDVEAIAIGRRSNMRRKSKNTAPQFVVCVRNENCEDLEIRKIYQVLPDEAAAEDEYIRVIDESGEDYLYPASYFFPVELPQEAEKELLSAA